MDDWPIKNRQELRPCRVIKSEHPLIGWRANYGD
jgi:hypothetical protein